MTRALWVTLCVVAAAAEARARRPRAYVRTVAAAASSSKPSVEGPSAQLLDRAKALYLSSDYADVLALARELEHRADLSLEQKLEVYRLLGSALAIVEDPLDAEPIARRLYNLRPDYQLPQGTPPKILNAFIKVQREVKDAIAQAERLDREVKISKMKVLDALPQGGIGGLPLLFAFRVLDPSSMIEKVVVHYRRKGQDAYQALGLEREQTGQWSGQIPGEVTADRDGFVFEHWVETSDAKGSLLCLGSQARPLLLEVAAGTVPVVRVKKPLPRGPFFALLAGTVAAGAVGTGFALGALTAQSQHNAYVTTSGTEWNAVNARGASYATAANVGWISAAVLGVTCLIVAFLTEWAP